MNYYLLIHFSYSIFHKENSQENLSIILSIQENILIEHHFT